MKKICIIYANCQGKLLANYLQKSCFFNQEYRIKIFPVHVLMQQKSSVPDRLLKQAKLFIYQPVKEIHGERSTQFILDKLPANCNSVSFPSLYFTGYIPQSCKNPVNKIVKPNYPAGLMAQGDSNIISMIEAGKSTSEIIETLSDPDFYSQEFLLAHLEETLTELARRESHLNIKVSQFIKANFRNLYLFNTRQHPTDILGLYVVNQILNLLGLPQLEQKLVQKDAKLGVLNNIQVPVYPSTIEHLNLSCIDSTTTYRHFGFCTNSMTFSRYISEYICLHKSTSNSANTYYFKGIRLANENKPDRAAIALKEAIKIKPDNAAYYGELASAFCQQNELDKAELVYKKAIEISPDWLDFYKSLGQILATKGDLTKSALIYKQALKLDPNHEELCSLLGDILINLERLDIAEKCYLQATKLEPEKARNYRCLGDIYRQQNNFDRAVTYYKKAIAIAPRNPWLYIHLSETLIEQNKIKEANDTCKRSLNFEKSQKTGFYRRVGDLQVKIGSFDDAIDTYKRAIKLNPNQNHKVLEQIRSQIDRATNAKECSQIS